MPYPEHSYLFSAPAKINLDLQVVGRRQDGYHLLCSHMTFLTWHDQLVFRQEGEGIDFSCSPTLGNPEDNLALRAARRMRALAPHAPGIKIHLEKKLPVAAGLGGGSSDAATVMLVLNRLWQVGLNQEALIELGVTLGADLPIFLAQKASLVEGIGEQLTPLSQWPQWDVLLLNPNTPLSTKDVFRAYGEGLTKVARAISITHLPRGKKLENPLVNDLQPVSQVLAPVVGEMVGTLQGAGAWLAAMSGSGPSVFGLFENSWMAAEAARVIGSAHGEWLLFQGRTCNEHPFEQEWRRQFGAG